jgi:PAS domain S-box-containing protein
VNRALAEINGLPPEAHRGHTVSELLPGVSPTVMQALERVRDTGEVLSHEAHGTTPAKPGEPRAWAVSYYPVRVDGDTVGVGAICEEITARQRAEDALRLARQRLDYVVEAVDMGLWFCDLPFGVLHWNAKAREHFGLEPAGEITLDVFYECIHPDDRERVRLAVDRAINDGDPYDVDFRTAPADNGEYRWLRAAGSVFRDAEGLPQRFDGITLDITARRQEQEQLLRSNEDLQQFAYAASHDMQEPLRTVASYVQLLQRRYTGKLDEQADEYIRYAVDGAKRMRSLIEDLLAYSRAGADHLPMRETDARTILQQTLEALRASIQDSGAQITHGELPLVMADDAQFALLLQNLVSNAIKYRRPGVAPRIHIGALRRGGEWVFSVRDNGSGFDAVHAEAVFAPFKRLHGREVAGTGIGLALCRRIVERHGGRIWAESRKGEGSTFSFTLPAVMEVHASVA